MNFHDYDKPRFFRESYFSSMLADDTFSKRERPMNVSRGVINLIKLFRLNKSKISIFYFLIIFKYA